MKILVGSFTTESNEKAPYITRINNYDIAFGDDLINVMEIKEAFPFPSKLKSSHKFMRMLILRVL